MFDYGGEGGWRGGLSFPLGRWAEISLFLDGIHPMFQDLCQNDNKKINIGTPENQKGDGSGCDDIVAHAFNVPIERVNLEDNKRSGRGDSNGKGLANDLRSDENELVEVHARSDKETNISQDKGKAILDEAVDGVVDVPIVDVSSENDRPNNHTMGSSSKHVMVDGSSRGGNSSKGLDNNICSDGNELVEINKSKDKKKAIFDLNETVWPEDEPFSNIFETCGEIPKDCEHSWIWKEGSGHVCWICGTIDKDHPLPPGFGSDSSKDVNPGLGTGIYPHPLHQSCMNLRHMEIFNFFCNNLAVENPNGCILAQAPVSEKIFLLINFIYGYLAKHPDSKVLFVLPKSMSQQLEVLNRWMCNRSIIFLCGKQFSNIVFKSSGVEVEASKDCRSILVNVPSLVIFDRGTDPKNEMMGVLRDVARIKTRNKILLTSTLYHNNIKDVFNVVDVAFPEFLRHNQAGKQLSKFLKVESYTHDQPLMDLEEALLSQDSDHGVKIGYLTELRMLTNKIIYNHNGEFLREDPGLMDFTVVLKPTLSQKSAWEAEKKSKTKGFKTSSNLSGITLHPVLNAFSDRVKGLPPPKKDEMDEVIKSIDETDGVKTKFFLGLVKLCDYTNEKIIVVSQYVIPLIFLQRLVAKNKGWEDGKETFMIKGDTSLSAREMSINQFNNSHDAKIFFVSIKACNEQMALTGATRVLMLDVISNTCIARQAIELTYRRGQQKKVYSYRLVAADTSEEDEEIIAARKEIISGIWFDGKTYPVDGKFCIPTIDGSYTNDYLLGASYMRDDIKTIHKR
ncbi:PREDICTED: protein CHROMATIN REMODELING 35-like [Camelina sativa]|uniref:Protein CHROMATIN REMODELING 35-like n=1 Tax=Camelina sativa TaxID=90675 RepID=A0ABM0T185_CAMSA|nr:PREDICTED: protein CHROMATIN REMODELING 35-like [Camelina sativa]